MRRQDELIAIYPSQDLMSRKFVLVQLLEFSRAWDAEEVLGLFRAGLTEEDASLRSQSLSCLVRFLPGYIQQRYALAPATGGVWSLLHSGATGGLMAPRPVRPDMERIARRRRGACAALAEPVVRALIPLCDHAEARVRMMALLALGHMKIPCTLEALRPRLGSARFVDMLGFAVARDAGCEDEALAAAIKAAGDPDALLLTAYLARDRTLSAVDEHAPRTNLLGRVNLAIALGAQGAVPGPLPMTPLLAAREIWTVVHTLDALRAAGDPAGVDLIARVYRATRSEFVRAHAVRAISGLPGPQSEALCRDALGDPAPAVQVEALEGLVRLGGDLATMQAAARPLVESASLRTRVNAILATAGPGDSEIPTAVVELLTSTDPVERLEAGYVLGYLQSQVALGCLALLAGEDPSALVRVQAVKSLSKYPVDTTPIAFLELVSSGSPPVAEAAARGLARYEGEGASLGLEAVEWAIQKAPVGLGRALLLRCYGTLARKAGRPRVGTVLGSALADDARVMLGALEGWSLFGGGQEETERESLREIVRTADGPAAARAALALFTNGEPEALELVAALLRRASGPSLEAALETALEMALLMFHAPLVDRFDALEERLDARAPAPAPETPPPPAPPAPPDRADADVGDGAFAVRRSGKTMRPLSLASAAGAAHAPLGGLLASSEAKRRAEAPLDARQLSRVTPWTAAARAGVEESDSSSGVMIGALMGQSRGPVVPVAALVALVSLVAVSVGVIAMRTRTVRPAPPSRITDTVPVVSPAVRPPMMVEFAHGEVRLERATEPGWGKPVPRQGVLTTGHDSAAGLVTRAGCWINMGPDSRLTCVSYDEEGRDATFVFEGQSCEFDFQRGGRLEVVIGLRQFECGAGWVRIETVDGGRRLRVLRGSVTYAGKRLAEGQQLGLD